MQNGSFERPDPQVARDYYRAMDSLSVDGVKKLLDPNIVWHVPGRHSRSGTYLGVDETMGLFDEFSRARNRKFEIEDVLSGDRYVMVLVRTTERNGNPCNARFIHVMRTKTGCIAESWHFDEDQSRLDELVNEES